MFYVYYLIYDGIYSMKYILSIISFMAKEAKTQKC